MRLRTRSRQMRERKENQVERKGRREYCEGSETENLDDMHTRSGLGRAVSSPGGGERRREGGKEKGPIDQGF